MIQVPTREEIRTNPQPLPMPTQEYLLVINDDTKHQEYIWSDDLDDLLMMSGQMWSGGRNRLNIYQRMRIEQRVPAYTPMVQVFDEDAYQHTLELIAEAYPQRRDMRILAPLAYKMLKQHVKLCRDYRRMKDYRLSVSDYMEREYRDESYLV